MSERKFKKYSSIENHYRGKYIDRFTSRFPYMINEQYIATEKLHGANFSIHIFDNGEEVLFGKRTALLNPEEGFMNHQAVMSQEGEAKLISVLKDYCEVNNIELMRVYGEIFGKGVQKFDYDKIDTPTKKAFRLFDMEIDGVKLLPVDVFNILDSLNVTNMFVPIIAIVDDLQEALDIDTKFKSKFSSDECTYDCEGIVIRPYCKQPEVVYEDKTDIQNFILKKKNEHFSDKAKADKNAKVFKMSEEGNRLLSEYKSYFTKARIESVFSKEGTITTPQQFGEYIKYMSEDVKEDFFKDFLDDFKILDDKEKSSIFKVCGQLTVSLLKQYL